MVWHCSDNQALLFLTTSYLLPPTTYGGTCTLPYLYTYEHGSWNAEGDASRDGEDPDSANTIPPPGSLLGTYRYHTLVTIPPRR